VSIISDFHTILVFIISIDDDETPPPPSLHEIVLFNHLLQNSQFSSRGKKEERSKY